MTAGAPARARRLATEAPRDEVEHRLVVVRVAPATNGSRRRRSLPRSAEQVAS